MTSPAPDATPPPPTHTTPPLPAEWRDRPPADHAARRLARPPSERYAAGWGGRPLPPGVTPRARGLRQMLRALAPAIVACLVTAVALVLVGGVLAEQRGLLAIAGLGGALVGLLGANGAVSPDGVVPPVLTRALAVRAAIGLAVVAIAAGATGTWAYGRLEGGVLDPLTYLWTTFGPFIPAEAAIAALAATWGAGAGPIRFRS